MPGERLLRYNPTRNRNEKASRRYFRKRGPTYGAPHDFPSFFTSLLFRFTAVFAGANAASKERSVAPGAQRAGKGRLLRDGGVFMRRSRREDSANRDGSGANGGDPAAAHRCDWWPRYRFGRDGQGRGVGRGDVSRGGSGCSHGEVHAASHVERRRHAAGIARPGKISCAAKGGGMDSGDARGWD